MSKKITRIKMNDPQPAECPKCKSKEGYQYHDTFKMDYVSFHNADGKYEGGQYTDGIRLRKGIAVYCRECLEKLPFRMLREDGESV